MITRLFLRFRGPGGSRTETVSHIRRNDDMLGFFAALLSGALMSIQGVFNTEVTKQTSLWVSAGWVQISAFAVCVLAWFFTGRESVSVLW